MVRRSEYGHFANDRTLSQADINTLVAWANNGAPEGDAKDDPPPLTFPEGWNIKPDMIIEMPKDVPRDGHRHHQLPEHPGQSEFPGRHVGGGGRDARRKSESGASHEGDRTPARRPHGCRRLFLAWRTKKVRRSMAGAKEGTDLLGKYNPGLGAQRFDVDGSAKFVPKGSDIVFNIHYTSIGTEQTDRSKVGLVFAKHPPKTPLLDVARNAGRVQSGDSGRG